LSSETEFHSLILVGRVARAHGNKGQVIVNPDTDFPDERFQVGRTVFAPGAGGMARPLVITSVRVHQGRPILGFDGVVTMNDAEALAGAELRVPESELVALPDGVFYHHHLVGCEVKTREGRLVGTVKAVEGPTERSTLVVDTRRGEVLIPLASEICVAIDPERRTIVIAPPEGLIELNEKGRWREEL
jgi:16S rRNA processing protein RimM